MIVIFILAAALGTMLRLVLDRLAPVRRTTSSSPWADWPYGILASNIVGTFVLGVLISWSSSHAVSMAPEQLFELSWPSGTAWLLSVGLCGSLTTVSTFVVGVYELYRQQRNRAVAYALTTLMAAVCAALLGLLLGAKL